MAKGTTSANRSESEKTAARKIRIERRQARLRNRQIQPPGAPGKSEEQDDSQDLDDAHGGIIGSGTFAGGGETASRRPQPPAQPTPRLTQPQSADQAPQSTTDQTKQPPVTEPEPPTADQPPASGRPSTTDKTQQLIKQQKKMLERAQKRADKTKEKHDKNVEQKNWKRILSKRKLKAREKELSREKKTLKSLEQTLTAQLGTGMLLKAAWLNLIPSFGLTYFYIAFHFLAAYLTPFSEFFVKFGEEWLPKTVRKTPGAKQAVAGIGLAEIVGCIGIGIILAVIFGIALVLFIGGAYAVIHTADLLLKFLGEILGGILAGVRKAFGFND